MAGVPMCSFPSEEAFCGLCGYAGAFLPVFPGASLRETRCPVCAASRRTRDMARALLVRCAGDLSRPLEAQLSLLRFLSVYELQAQGPLHDRLAVLPSYVCSEFYPDVAPGSITDDGVLCQDAERLTFPDASFDLVISQDIMEHLADPWSGFSEIQRTLRPGGTHLCTFPVHEGHATRQRAVKRGTTIKNLLPPVHHKDPLNAEGALVFWDFGEDLPEALLQYGISAEPIMYTPFYLPEDICSLDTASAYARYLEARENNSIVSLFLYNSIVFACGRA